MFYNPKIFYKKNSGKPANIEIEGARCIRSCWCILNYQHGKYKPIINTIGLDTLEVLSMSLRTYLPSQANDDQHFENLDGDFEFFLRRLSKLKVLKLFRCPISSMFPDSFLNFDVNDSKMFALSELYLYGPVVKSFRFLQYTPNIVKLCIDNECFLYRKLIKKCLNYVFDTFRIQLRYHKRFDFFVYNLVYAPKDFTLCTQLKHFEIDYEFNVESLTRLALWMPLLQILKTKVNLQIIDAICRSWPNLKELTCTFGSSIENKSFYNDKKKKLCRQGILSLKS